MTILNKRDPEILGPGVERHEIVSGDTGADSLSVAEVNVIQTQLFLHIYILQKRLW